MPKEKWTLEVLQSEANKYKYRTDFAKGSPNAYSAAARKKLLDSVCKHMEVKQRDASLRRFFDSEQEVIVAEEYISGFTMREIADKHGTTATNVLHVLRRLGVETRGTGDHNLGNYRFSKEEEDEIIWVYENQVISILNLAKKMNASTPTISKMFKRRNVRLRAQADYAPEPKNLIGRKFGRWKVIAYAGRDDGKAKWVCICECGRSDKKIVLANNLLRGISKSCGCLGAESNRIDLIDRKFGRLKVTSFYKESEPGRPKWNCICKCGKQVVVLGSSLRLGTTKSCGCLKAEGSSAYDNPDIQKKREEKHINLLNAHGRVELVGQFKGRLYTHNYRCIEHDEIHPARSDQLERGDGLRCCRLANNQFDSLDKAISGDLRNATDEEWLYIYEMKRYPDLVKIGISKDPSTRANNIEYGEEIASWLFEERVDAYIVEQSIHRQTISSAILPDDLQSWKGGLEIRELGHQDAEDIAQYFVDGFYELGRWEFALAYAPLTERQKHRVLEKYF